MRIAAVRAVASAAQMRLLVFVLAIVAALLGGAMAIDASRRAELAQNVVDSDRFWGRFAISGIYGEQFGSLRESLLSSDGVILARVVGAGPGRVARDLEAESQGDFGGTVYFANVVVQIDETLAGPMRPGSKLQLEFLVGSRDAIPGGSEGAPKERSLFLLRDKLVMAERFGWSEEEKKQAAGFFVLETPETLFRDLGGTVRVLRVASSEYIREQDGRPFGDFLADAKALLASWEP